MELIKRMGGGRPRSAEFAHMFHFDAIRAPR